MHRVTGFTPFYLLFGRESRLHVDGAFPTFNDKAKPGRISHDSSLLIGRVGWEKPSSLRMFEPVVNPVILTSNTSSSVRSYNSQKFDAK